MNFYLWVHVGDINISKVEITIVDGCFQSFSSSPETTGCGITSSQLTFPFFFTDVI